MEKTIRLPHLVLLLALLPLACASYDATRGHLDASPLEGTPGIRGAIDGVKDNMAEREKVQKASIHVECSVYYVGESVGSPGGCSSIDFAFEDENGIEVGRRNPDSRGKIDFPVQVDKPFHVIPKVPSAWTIEVIPATDVKAGDSVRVILRR